jgi:hypothetical protein
MLGEDSPAVRPTFCSEDQPMGVIRDGEASTTNEAPTDEDTPPDLEYAGGLRSIYTAADETFFQNNFDIPMSVRIHYPEADQGVFPKPGSEDICFHKRMLLASLHFSL